MLDQLASLEVISDVQKRIDAAAENFDQAEWIRLVKSNPATVEFRLPKQVRSKFPYKWTQCKNHISVILPPEHNIEVTTKEINSSTLKGVFFDDIGEIEIKHENKLFIEFQTTKPNVIFPVLILSGEVDTYSAFALTLLALHLNMIESALRWITKIKMDPFPYDFLGKNFIENGSHQLGIYLFAQAFLLGSRDTLDLLKQELEQMHIEFDFSSPEEPPLPPEEERSYFWIGVCVGVPVLIGAGFLIWRLVRKSK